MENQELKRFEEAFRKFNESGGTSPLVMFLLLIALRVIQSDSTERFRGGANFTLTSLQIR
tara:strand:+ start:674 stop:853 length:180 start_codon:yes stop_codon:yes gene_type:complete